MPDNTPSPVCKVSPEQRRIAAGQFERANQALASQNFDYAIQLLRNCCLLDPGNLIFRQTLRQAQKNRHGDNQRGQTLFPVTALPTKVRLHAALKREDYLQALDLGEQILVRNPWDVATHLAMARAFEALGLVESAMWILDQARKVQPMNPKVNRHLAQILENRGNFTQAVILWEMVRKALPRDEEAQNKAKDLAANDTIARFGTKPTEPVETPAGAAAAEPTADAPAVADTPVQPSKSRGSREIVSLEARVEADPANANNYLQLAAYLRRHDQLDRAREILQRGLEAAGNNFDIGLELMDLDIEPFRRNLAVTEDRLRRQPDSDELQKIRLRLVKEIATRELDFFRKKADRYPNEAGHRFEMGVRLLQLGQVDEAIKELQVVRSDPRHKANALYYLGFCFLKRNNWRLAQRNFEDALQNMPKSDDPTRKEILYQLARGHAGTGDLAQAVDLGCELANLDYGYKDISQLLDDWQNRLQKA